MVSRSYGFSHGPRGSFDSDQKDDFLSRCPKAQQLQEVFVPFSASDTQGPWEKKGHLLFFGWLTFRENPAPKKGGKRAPLGNWGA